VLIEIFFVRQKENLVKKKVFSENPVFNCACVYQCLLKKIFLKPSIFKKTWTIWTFDHKKIKNLVVNKVVYKKKF